MAAISVGAAQAYIEGVYGGPTEETDHDYTVGTSVKNIATNDPEGLALAIANLGSNSLYVMFDDQVSASHGFLVPSGGGLLSVNVRDDQTLPTRAWWAVSPDGNTDVIVIRTRRYALT